MLIWTFRILDFRMWDAQLGTYNADIPKSEKKISEIQNTGSSISDKGHSTHILKIHMAFKFRKEVFPTTCMQCHLST